MVGKGRPYRGTRIEIRIPDELLDAIDERATTKGLSRPEMIRRLLQEAMNR